jgi:hypothetical protein
MVGVFAALTLALVVGPAAAAGASPGSPTNVRVTPPSGVDDQQPSLALDPARPNEVAIAYVGVEDGAAAGFPGEKVKTCGLARSVDAGRTWRSRTLVGRGGVMATPGGFAACWNPSVAYGPRGHLYYLFQTSLTPSNPSSQVWLTVSSDDGASFAAPVPVDPAAPAYPGQRAGGDWWPTMAVDPRSGVVTVTWSSFTPVPDTSAIMVASSADQGRSFSVPARVTPPSQLDVTGSSVQVGSGGSVLLSWIDYTEWERGDASACGAPCLQPGYAGLLQAFYAGQGTRADYTQGLNCYEIQGGYPEGNDVAGSGCAQPAKLWSAVSTGTGAAFRLSSSPAVAVPLGCPVTGQSVSVDPTTKPCDPLYASFYDHNVSAMTAGARPGQIYLAWWDTGTNQDNAGAQGPGRLSLASSTDGGATWQVRAAIGVTAASDQQYRPWLSTAPDGRVDIIYYDRTSASGQSVDWVSLTGGRLASPVLLTSKPSSVSVGPMGDNGVRSFGDHLAAASTDKAVDAAWTDARRPATHQAVYFARLDVGASDPGPHPPWSLIVILGVAAVVVVVGMVVAWRRHGAGSRASTEPRGEPS